MKFHLVEKSRNAKVGPIPVSTSAMETCPNACPLKSGGCYAKGGPLAMHWRAVTSGERGDSWSDFVSKIAAFPAGQAWRHNQAGDLPGVNNAIDKRALGDLVAANIGKRGWTYTHKPMTAVNARAVKSANDSGFTINLSADNLAEADKLAELGAGPVVVVLDAVEGRRADTTTPSGRTVVTCPATYRDNVTCQSCMLCAVASRKVIVGFPAHGASKKSAAAIARG